MLKVLNRFNPLSVYSYSEIFNFIRTHFLRKYCYKRLHRVNIAAVTICLHKGLHIATGIYHRGEL